MQLVLEIREMKDLDILIPLLKRLKINFVKKHTQEMATSQNLQALSKYIGSLPNLDTESFELYLQQLRSEWERPIS